MKPSKYLFIKLSEKLRVSRLLQAFFSTLTSLMANCPRLQDVLFSVEERRRVGPKGDILAPNFQHFTEKLAKLGDEFRSRWTLAKLPLTFHQHFLTYQRVEEMHMWRFRRKKEGSEVIMSSV